jgi:hypothetical protein
MAQTLVFPVHPAWQTGRRGAIQVHQRLPWKPVELPHNPNLELGQAGPGTYKTIALGALLLPTAAAAAAAFVGFRLGSKDEEGWVSVLGYLVGALGSIAAVMGVLAMLGVAVTPFTLPQEPIEVSALPAATPAPAKI